MREKVMEISRAIRNRKGSAFDTLTPSEVTDYIADCIEFVLDPYAALDRDPAERPLNHCTRHTGFAHDCPDCHSMNPVNRKYKLVTCDCDQTMKCPQGKIGDATRCSIWVKRS